MSKSTLDLSLNISLPELDISGFSSDSRKVKPGEIFFDFTGNGGFIQKAFGQGAVLAITGNEELADQQKIFFHPSPRLAYTKVASAFYPKQPDHVIAVTGTNGKSSTVDFIRQLFTAQNIPAASVGTIGIIGEKAAGLKLPSLTTPDAKDLHKTLDTLADRGVEAFIFEASSHGLDQYRLHGAHVNVAGFTNLTQDHLDYHGTMENYFEAKSKLFLEVLAQSGTAVINADCPYGRRLIALCQEQNIKVFSYGITAEKADLRGTIVTFYARGIRLNITYQDQQIEVDVPVIGDFQASNILCALGIALARLNMPLANFEEALHHLTPPPGRMEHIATTDQGADIFIDYAHTPDALKRALESLSHHVNGKIYVVFGCGGDRDKEKRPLMGEVARQFAHFSIITDDNPRSEDPEQIRLEIRENHPLALDVPGRATAIAKGLAMLRKGDALLVAGKGHEETQTFKDETIPFSDRQVILECLHKKAG